MIKLRVWMRCGAVVVALSMLAAVGVGQDFWDDESLFAAEELTIDEAVTGSLPEGDGQDDDDLFDALFGGDTGGFDDVVFADDDLDGDAFEALAEADDAFESVDADADFADLFEQADLDASRADETLDAFETDTDWTADDVLSDMMETGDRDLAGETVTDAGFDDLFAADPEPEPATPAPADDDFDDLFGEWIASEPEAQEPAATVDPEPEVAAEPDVADDVWDDLAFEEEDKGGPAEELVPEEDVDFDALFSELAMEDDPVFAPDDDWDTGPEAPEAVVATDEEDDWLLPEPEIAVQPEPEPEVVPEPELAVETEPEVVPEPEVEVVAEPEPAPVYEDAFALDDDLFSDLAAEGRGLAADPPPTVREPVRAAPAPVTEPTAVAAPAPVPEPEAPATARPAPPPAQPAEVAPPPTAPEGAAAFEEAERMRRIARENHALSSLDRAENALRDRDFRRAVQMYEEAMRHLPRRADMEPARARARRGLAEAYFRQSESLERMGDYEAALTAAQNATRQGHRRGEDAVRRIQRLMEDPPQPEPAPTPPRWQQEDFQRIDREIEDWLKRGREAYLTGEYERAVLAFESVLARDPENKEAIRMMRAAANRQYDRSTMELDATRSRMLAAVRDTWNPRQYGLHEEPIEVDLTGTTTGRPEEERQRQRIMEKMENIRLPEVNFRQANIRDVLNFLHQQSVEFDPAPVRAERTGVSIILNLDPGSGRQAATPPAGRRAAPPTDFFTAPAADAADGQVGDSLITFSALDISLKEALDIVVDVASLKYRIRGNVVMVVPRDAAEGDIEHRMYDVLPSAITRLQELSTAVQGRGGAAQRRGPGDFLALDGGGDLGGDDLDLKAFFTEMGVEWPARSSIKFVRGIGKLVVANTQENLTVFERVLSILNVVPYQIEIEARFVEVAQTDVDSLGLEWMLTDTWQIAEMAADAAKPPAARRRIVMNENETTGGFTQGNRFLTQGGTRGPLGVQMMDQVASISSVLTNPELTMVLHALQQRGHTDLLSAPKITTQSGQQATIKVVTEYIYPTAFETSGIGGETSTLAGGGGGGTVGAVVTPLDFTTREVGVILEVLPEVSPEGQMINLLLSPEVVSEPTWRNFGSTYTSFDPNGNPVEQVLNMEQPFFHTRKLRTNLLIYNGATVVMGGMITEVRNSVDDKIPLLGDIPVLGRLFRSKYDSSEKRNLLIFVTARLVDPAGRPLDQERLGVDPAIAERLVATDD